MAQNKFSVVIRGEAYQNLINSTLGDKEVARNFISNIMTAVSSNVELGDCEPSSILSAGLMAHSLDLPLSQTLGFCYILPYKITNRQTNEVIKKAQFQVGYKGLVQLCLRTGQYETIGVREVHKGEYKGQNEFGEDEFKFSHDFDNNEIVGYFAYFKLLNGAKKTLYWTKEQCEKHGRKYSKSFNKLWTDSFDTMAMKTVLKQLISKYGIMSTKIENAVRFDQSVIENDKPVYVDNATIEEETKQVKNVLVDEESGEVKEVGK